MTSTLAHRRIAASLDQACRRTRRFLKANREKTIMASSNQGSKQGSNQGGNSQSSGTRNRGFASMDPARQREIASQGGKAAHAKGTAHEFTSEEARRAGSMSHGNRQSASASAGGASRTSSKTGGNRQSSSSGNRSGSKE
ncbi:KGG domain-containing protein [Massilia sp. DD77]|uniref:KGG domain-containing protein n=1 Tax=Massilia sp. DD77 TaxID=3109349 RepID=UPI003FA57ADF